ncbi:MAG TPA: hypothetical protein VHX90_02575 [Verrucomicrobiae bacterium]|jgi:hypothetical protein|nr:hypothetical protein [Verrucomicrobiae bacterium]
MKTYATLLAIGSLAVFQTVAAPQAGNSSASEMTAEKKIQVFTPLTPPPQTTEDKNKIERYGNMSSQPWTQIAGGHPAVSQFADGNMHGANLNLIWIGHEPWQ